MVSTVFCIPRVRPDFLLSTVLMLPLAGCISLPPPDSTPAVELPSTYQVGSTALSEISAAPNLPWRDYFTDLQLQRLIEQALTTNRHLRSALLRVEQARALYGIQQSELLPTIGAEASSERSRVPSDLNAPSAPQVSNRYEVGVGFNHWELDFWGRVRSLNEAALEEYLATDEARRAVELSLIAQVANSYYLLLELDNRLQLAHQTIASREQSLLIFNRRVEVGAAAQLELRQVEVLLHQARALGAQLENARAQQANALALLLGSPAETAWQLPPLADSDELFALPPGLPSELLVNRPDIRAAEHALRAANANISAARAAFFPRIALTSSLGTASRDLDNLFSHDSRTWQFAPTTSLPIFTAGRLRASLNLAEVRREQAVVDYEQTVQEAFRDVADALAAERWLVEEAQTASDLLAAQRERARLAQLRYDHGAVPYLEVLDAQRDLLDAEQQQVQIRRKMISARIALYAALGGGEHQAAIESARTHRSLVHSL
ncbi:efflux transporter outer membrane subunit [Halomonas sp. 707B3]|uniref:efflux transporter outer membrane subunit n=1 Tax=Halomonas sp. 707B3 TaxID=1681043 RepID=UPI00209F7F87|nr:efflux transporter outer membrane subunit [Halomonas sp. 707B3]MCP1318383.1 efflux transporter outer membrane subunit [Halomonas sp. 707B3]